MTMLTLDDTASSDPKHGCPPEDRPIEALLDAGVIMIDKPRGPTSHQLTAWAREMLGIQRLGHGGVGPGPVVLQGRGAAAGG